MSDIEFMSLAEAKKRTAFDHPYAHRAAYGHGAPTHRLLINWNAAVVEPGASGIYCSNPGYDSRERAEADMAFWREQPGYIDAKLVDAE